MKQPQIDSLLPRRKNRRQDQHGGSETVLTPARIQGNPRVRRCNNGGRPWPATS
jgi:hypothetical protein